MGCRKNITGLAWATRPVPKLLWDFAHRPRLWQLIRAVTVYTQSHTYNTHVGMHENETSWMDCHACRASNRDICVTHARSTRLRRWSHATGMTSWRVTTSRSLHGRLTLCGIAASTRAAQEVVTTKRERQKAFTVETRPERPCARSCIVNTMNVRVKRTIAASATTWLASRPSLGVSMHTTDCPVVVCGGHWLTGVAFYLALWSTYMRVSSRRFPTIKNCFFQFSWNCLAAISCRTAGYLKEHSNTVCDSRCRSWVVAIGYVNLIICSRFCNRLFSFRPNFVASRRTAAGRSGALGWALDWRSSVLRVPLPRMGRGCVTHDWASCSRPCAPNAQQYNLVPVSWRWRFAAGRVTVCYLHSLAMYYRLHAVIGL